MHSNFDRVHNRFPHSIPRIFIHINEFRFEMSRFFFISFFAVNSSTSIRFVTEKGAILRYSIDVKAHRLIRCGISMRIKHVTTSTTKQWTNSSNGVQLNEVNVNR